MLSVRPMPGTFFTRRPPAFAGRTLEITSTHEMGTEHPIVGESLSPLGVALSVRPTTNGFNRAYVLTSTRICWYHYSVQGHPQM